MDGNRRWAKERNIPSLEGHLKGYEVAKKSPDWFFKRGVEIISLFVFSAENWKRTQEEINYLMVLLRRAIDEELESALKKNHRILISGRLEELPGDLPGACLDVIEKTKNGNNGTVNLCINYGGKTELIDSFKKIIKNNPNQIINEELINQSLYFNLPDPDLIIRTSGEKRLSGFLLWQSAYSELFFLEKYWPDFEEYDVEVILNEFKKRKRRYGGN